jgi:hypothetical protein
MLLAQEEKVIADDLNWKAVGFETELTRNGRKCWLGRSVEANANRLVLTKQISDSAHRDFAENFGHARFKPSKK